MTLGLHDTRLRRRRRVRWAIAKWIIGLSAIVGAGVFAYETGSTLAERRVVMREEKILELTEQNEELHRQATELKASLILKQKRLSDARTRYQSDVPTGQVAALLGRVREKLEAGVDPGRLEFVIKAAQNPRQCDEKPRTKRFLVQTPLYKGANDSVSFAENTITVTATGELAKDSSGRIEAWFDPALPVTLRLTRIGGKAVETTGKLPLHASLVVGDAEYRYSAVAGAQRGFVQVTGDRCRYP